MEITEPWLDVDGIAAHLSVSTPTIYRWLEKGIPAHRLGKLWRFKASEVDAWVERGGADDTPAPKNTKKGSK